MAVVGNNAQRLYRVRQVVTSTIIQSIVSHHAKRNGLTSGYVEHCCVQDLHSRRMKHYTLYAETYSHYRLKRRLGHLIPNRVVPHPTLTSAAGTSHLLIQPKEHIN